MDATRKEETALLAKKRALEKELASVEKGLDRVMEVKTGDRPSTEQAKLFKQGFSYAVHFERRKVLRKVRSPGSVCKSLRRFSSRKEAEHHGKRFKRIHGHKGFNVIRVTKNPNAWVNWRTGKTNPVINR